MLYPHVFFSKKSRSPHGDFDVTVTDVLSGTRDVQLYTRTTPVLPSSRRDSHALSHHSLLLILPRRGDMMPMTAFMTSMQLLEPYMRSDVDPLPPPSVSHVR